jgi:hypothetical protein
MAAPGADATTYSVSVSDSDGVAAATRIRRVDRAYRRGRRYGAAERQLAEHAPEFVAVVDARALALRRWVERFSSAARWTLRGDIVERLVAGRRAEQASADAVRRLPSDERPWFSAHARSYAAGRAQSLRQLAARRLVDAAEARASAIWGDGAGVVLETFVRKSNRARDRQSTAAIRWMLREAALDVAATRARDAVGEFTIAALNALAVPSSNGLAWGLATAKRMAAPAPAVRASAGAVEDLSGRRMALAECELVAGGSSATLVAAEGWVRAYRDEADDVSESDGERRLLLARAQTVESALDRRAAREGQLIFYEALAIDQRGRRVKARKRLDPDARARILEMARASVDALERRLVVVGAERSVERWSARLRSAVEYEAGAWALDPPDVRGVHRMLAGIAVLHDLIRERSNSAWAWLGAPTGLGWGRAERVLVVRLVRGRALAVFSLAAGVAFAWLVKAAAGWSFAGAIGLTAVVFCTGVWRLATQDDPHWWRSGVVTLGIAGAVGMFVFQPLLRNSSALDMRAAVRLIYAFSLWLAGVPVGLAVARFIARSRTVGYAIGARATRRR